MTHTALEDLSGVLLNKSTFHHIYLGTRSKVQKSHEVRLETYDEVERNFRNTIERRFRHEVVSRWFTIRGSSLGGRINNEIFKAFQPGQIHCVAHESRSVNKQTNTYISKARLFS